MQKIHGTYPDLYSLSGWAYWQAICGTKIHTLFLRADRVQDITCQRCKKKLERWPELVNEVEKRVRYV